MIDLIRYTILALLCEMLFHSATLLFLCCQEFHEGCSFTVFLQFICSKIVILLNGSKYS